MQTMKKLERIQMTTKSGDTGQAEKLFGNNVRINFTDIFTPPKEGYQLAHVWGTSYSISLEAYIMVLLAMENQGNVPAIPPGQQISKAQILTIIERNQPKITLLAQQGLSYFNEKFSPSLQALLWKSIHPQVCKEKESFHPKVWLIAFENTQDNAAEFIFRLLVTSRNLTQDTDFDAAVVFESAPSDNQDTQGCKELRDLFTEKLLTVENSDKWYKRLGKVEFDKDKRFNVFDASHLPEDKPVHTVISPFLDNTKVGELMNKGLTNIFSTPEAISNLRDDIKKHPGVNFYVLRNMNTVLTNDGDPEDNSTQSDKNTEGDTSVKVHTV